VGTARINDLTACQAAATAAARPRPSSSENSDLFPKGCYSSRTSPNVYFNAHVTGAATQTGADVVLLCAVAGVPASPAPPRPRHPRACTHGRRHSIGAYSTVLTGTVPCRPCAHRACAQVPHGSRVVGAATPTTSPTAAPTTRAPTSLPTAATAGATGCAFPALHCALVHCLCAAARTARVASAPLPHPAWAPRISQVPSPQPGARPQPS
jgi:hypothetical protein